MTRPIVIANARVMDPATNLDAPGAVLVENGKITGITDGAPQGVPEGAERIDARGMVVAPGLIDMRVFTGEPGTEYRETLASAPKNGSTICPQWVWPARIAGTACGRSGTISGLCVTMMRGPAPSRSMAALTSLTHALTFGASPESAVLAVRRKFVTDTPGTSTGYCIARNRPARAR